MKQSLKLITLVLSSLAVTSLLRAGPTPTAADVGDAETFGHAALYMGATSGFENLVAAGTCPAPTATPSPAPNGDAFCDELNATPTTITTFQHDNICRINLPKKATRNIIYPALNIFLNYQLENSTPSDEQGFLNFTAGITIVSDALNGPDCIDQTTSAPCGGKIRLLFNYTYRDDRNMHHNDRQRLREVLVRVGNTGLTRQQFHDSFGLTNASVDALFAGPMSVQLDLSGTARMVTDANITCNMRLFGD